jgi:DNA-binding CsgD family transcriptional regulator/tetratricopeptide (TPR) repeat protein
MELLEREHFLRALDDYAVDAAAGSGRLVLLSGEAGVGKTALLEAFREQRGDLRWWWSACDGSFTPRPLGPLFELAFAAGGRLLALCAEDADRRELFAAFLEALDVPETTTVLVVEDLHWADDATLDWLRYLARRIATSRALVVASYRDDGPSDLAVLRPVIGDVATHRGTRRLSLPALSPAAVRRMAGERGGDADRLHSLTGGVPFYVREVLSTAPGDVPRTVGDVVAARTAPLSPRARQLLAAAAVLARPAEASLLAAVAELDSRAGTEALDECVDSGTLVGGPATYRFRHELTRLAVERAIPARHRSQLHATALTTLGTVTPEDHARLAHHAEAAGAADEALRHARLAAADAVTLRSHREAAAQFRRALRFAGGTDPATRAVLHEGLATASALMDHWEESARERAEALSLRRQLGDAVKISENLRGLARCLWRLCRGEESEAAVREALTVMADQPPSEEKAWAHVLHAASISETQPRAQALSAAREGLRQAEAADCRKAVAYSLNTIGMLELGAGRDGFTDIAHALGLALEHRLEDEAGRGYATLYQAAVDRYRFAEYTRLFDEGTAFCHEHETATYGVCLRGSHATALLRTGRLAEAVALAEETLREAVSPVNRLQLLITLCAAYLRQGDPRADTALEQAWQLATGNGERGWLLRVATVSAEAAWLAGRAGTLDGRVVDVAGSDSDDDVWLRAELTVWLDRLDVPGRRPASLPEPHALELDGEHDDAARWWHDAGCPFEEAVALTRASRPGRLGTALELVTSIGAERAAARVRQLMREAGERAVPRGARRATRANPHGLTPREAEVHALLHEGLSNAAIARRLYISERTVHHHVSAVLAKLGLSSRNDVRSLAKSE